MSRLLNPRVQANRNLFSTGSEIAIIIHMNILFCFKFKVYIQRQNIFKMQLDYDIDNRFHLLV